MSGKAVLPRRWCRDDQKTVVYVFQSLSTTTVLDRLFITIWFPTKQNGLLLALGCRSERFER